MITKLSIKNFRGIEKAEYDNFGFVNAIYGRNGSGKSTVLDCLMWMITGETLTFGNSASVNDKCISETSPNSLIDCEITINGNVLRRTYGYKYNEEEDTTTEVNAYYSNGRRCKNKKEYFEEVNRFLDFNLKTREKINLVSALINPYTFGKGVDQPIFRRFIKEILNVDFDSILFANEKYQKIQLDYNAQGRDINNVKDLYKQKTKKVDSELDEINLKIASAENVEVNEEEYHKLLSEKNNVSLSKFEFNEKVYELTNELNKTKIDLANSRHDDIVNNVSEEEKSLGEQIKNLRVEINSNIDQYNVLNNDLIMCKQKIRINENNVELKASYIKEVEESTFRAIICPECSCVVNKDEEENFNHKKAESIKKAQEEIDTSKEELEKSNKLLKELEKKLEEKKTLVVEGKKDLEELKQKLSAVQNDEEKNIVSEKTKSLEQKSIELELEIIKLREEDAFKMQEFLRNQNEKLQELNQKLLEIEIAKRKLNELNSIKEKKKQLLVEKAKLVSLLDTTKDFALDQVRITKEYTCKIFGDDVEFVMLKQQKTNDTLKEVCYAQVKGISYDNLNTANALLTGIIVVEKIKAYLGIQDLPIIFDICDNIGNKIMEDILAKTTSQVFYTEVDKTDKSERVLKVIK